VSVKVFEDYVLLCNLNSALCFVGYAQPPKTKQFFVWMPGTKYAVIQTKKINIQPLDSIMVVS